MIENENKDKKNIIDEIIEKKKNFDRNQKIIFVISVIIFFIALSHIITDVFFH